MKKLSVILLVCCLFFTFCGCDKQMVSSDNEMKIDNLAAQNEVFASSLAGNVYMTKEGNVLTLKELRDTDVDMFTTVFIGNSQTKNINGKMVTPRGYRNV